MGGEGGLQPEAQAGKANRLLSLPSPDVSATELPRLLFIILRGKMAVILLTTVDMHYMACQYSAANM